MVSEDRVPRGMFELKLGGGNRKFIIKNLKDCTLFGKCR
jgi:hypothetical protein